MRLVHQATAELVGTAFLVAAQHLSPSDTGLQLLENSLITGAVLVALILARCRCRLPSTRSSPSSNGPSVPSARPAQAVLIATQVLGGILGSVIANPTFELPAATFSAHDRTG